MQNATTVALSRLVAQQRSIDVTATNIANASTTGYRAERTLFSDWLSRQSMIDAPNGGRVITYAQDRATYREQRGGAITQTANPLDLALAGEGYFSVETPRGPRLTRAGRFEMQPDGRVADVDGNALLDDTGRPIQLSPGDTRIKVSGDGSLSSENGRIGKIGVVVPDDPNRLEPEGGRLFSTASTTTPVTQPKIIQGAVEDSNVSAISETTRMMTTLREYEFAAQFVQAESERQQTAIDKLTQQRI